jgi:anti-anti-sigma factor
MEIKTQEYTNCELITVMGRVDTIVAAQLAQALTDAHQRGRYRIVVDMGLVDYMSSAGFRALGDAQRNCKRHEHGEVILTQVPALVQEALDLVGFTEHFRIINPLAAALEIAENLPASDSVVGDQPAPV